MARIQSNVGSAKFQCGQGASKKRHAVLEYEGDDTHIRRIRPSNPVDDAIGLAVQIAIGSLSLPGGPRVYVEGTIEIDGLVEGEETLGRTLTFSLQTPPLRPDGRRQSRGVLNFGKWLIDGAQLDNYIEIPTAEGPLRLHLIRDGTLGFEEDGGEYT